MLKYQRFHGRAAGYSLYVPRPQLPGNSQLAPVDGRSACFLLVSSLGLLGENAPATDVFVFELAISDVGQECQLGACVPTQTSSLWIFPSMLGKQS